MRLNPFLALVLLSAPLAWAEGPAPLINPTGGQVDSAAALPADASVDQVLDALDQRGKTMREFTAKVSDKTGNPDLGEDTTSTGRIWFQKIGEDDGRIHVIFDKKKEGKITKDEKTEYLLENGWFTDRNYHKNVQTRRQVTKPGEKINLLKLGEGAFPLPIGQKKEDVHKLFDVKEIAHSPKDPPDTIHLQLTPKEGTHFARRFGMIDVWVDRTRHFPVQIRTENPDKAEPHLTKLEDVQVNPPGGLKDSDFTLPPIEQETWTLHTEPYRE